MCFEKDKIYTSSVRTCIQISSDLLKTERQWAKAGYIAINKNCGKMLWVNRYCNKKLLYLYVDEVRVATQDELLEFFRPEREKQDTKNKIKRQKKLIEKINDMCNSGMFNDIIKGYCIIVCKELCVQDEVINDYNFDRLFDFVGAEQARIQSEKSELQHKIKRQKRKSIKY